MRLSGCSRLALVVALGGWLAPLPALAGSTDDDVARRLDRLEQENQELRREVQALTRSRSDAQAASDRSASTQDKPRQSPSNATQAPPPPAPPPPPPLRPSQRDGDSGKGFVRFDSQYSYDMLDPTTSGKSKPLALLDAKRSGRLDASGLVLGGAITALVDYQHTNVADDFGYLMRQPGANHIGNTVTEAVLHTVQVGITANINRWLSGYAEILYDPEQSFAAGTITALDRNQLQLRRGYVLIGDLDASPFYGMIGKIDSPFGQTDTVNPFTLSTDWHAFSGLSYGALVGYSHNGLNISAEAAQGGAEFRGLNAPVHDTNVPSLLNNFVVDANYTIKLGERDRTLLVGASYEGGSSYCQGFPIMHFGACDKSNPAWAAYAELKWDAFTLKGDYMQTVDVWPGTFNPNPPLNVFEASRVSSFDVGGKYEMTFLGRELDASLDYSILIAGPDGSPWHRQDQLVAGLAYFLLPNAKLFAEAILIKGYEPLQFLTGGVGGDPTDTESDQDNRSHVFLAGANVAF